MVASLKVEISLTLMEIPDRLYVGNASRGQRTPDDPSARS